MPLLAPPAASDDTLRVPPLIVVARKLCTEIRFQVISFLFQVVPAAMRDVHQLSRHRVAADGTPTRPMTWKRPPRVSIFKQADIIPPCLKPDSLNPVHDVDGATSHGNH
jgi:hypothetical protein